MACGWLFGVALVSSPARVAQEEVVSEADLMLLEELELLRDWELLVNWDPSEDLPIPIESDPNEIGERGERK